MQIYLCEHVCALFLDVVKPCVNRRHMEAPVVFGILHLTVAERMWGHLHNLDVLHQYLMGTAHLTPCFSTHTRYTPALYSCMPAGSLSLSLLCGFVLYDAIWFNNKTNVIIIFSLCWRIKFNWILYFIHSDCILAWGGGRMRKHCVILFPS